MNKRIAVVLSLGDDDFLIVPPEHVTGIKPYVPYAGAPNTKTRVCISGGPAGGYKVYHPFHEVAEKLGFSIKGEHPKLTRILGADGVAAVRQASENDAHGKNATGHELPAPAESEPDLNML